MTHKTAVADFKGLIEGEKYMVEEPENAPGYWRVYLGNARVLFAKTRFEEV